MTAGSFTDRPFAPTPAEPRRKRRALPEQAIQRAIFQHIAARGTPGVFAFHVPNGGKRSPIEAAIFKGIGVRAGVPDVLVLKHGTLFCLELKAGKGRLSAAQEAVADQMAFAGAVVTVARGLDEALYVLERWGVLRGRAV